MIPISLRLAWRALSGRRSRVVLVVACLCLGVMARVTVGSTIADAGAAVDRESRTIVGADLLLSADSPLDEQRRQDLAEYLPAGWRSVDVRSTVTMASRADGEAARLVLLRAPALGWPLRGVVELEVEGAAAGQSQRYDAAALAEVMDDGSALVQRDLLLQLDVAVGDTLRLGELDLRIGGVLIDEPGGGSVMMSIGPTVLITPAALEASGLAGFAARVTHQTQIVLPWEVAPETAASVLRTAWELPEPEEGGFFRQVRPGAEIQLTTASESLAAVQRFLNRFGDFLRMLALLALLLGAVGVAHLVRGHVVSTLADSALLGVLGARPGAVVGVMAWQVALLGLAGGLVGALLGAGLHMTAVLILGGILPLELSGLPHLPSMAWGLALGLIAALVAGLAPVVALRRLSPLAVLRDEQTRLPSDRLLALGILGLGLVVAVLISAAETRSWRLGPALILGAVVVALGIGAVARLLLPLMARLRLGHPGLRHGLANLARPGFRPTAAVVALGVAACTLGVLGTYRASLEQALSSSLGERAPALYAIEIPDTEIERLVTVAEGAGAVGVETAAMVTARLRAINGKPINAANLGQGREAERRLWALTREQRLSWREDLGPDEEIVAGRWMAADSVDEISIATTFADAAGLDLGDELTIDIQGFPITGRITSVREVDWLGFRLNFFLLLSPETLAPAPRQWLATMGTAPEADGLAARMAIQAALAREFPMVTTIDVAEQVNKARAVLERMSTAVVALSVIALLAGICVLIGICAASAGERRYDSALLRVCGAGDGDLRLAVLAEFAAIGLIASCLGVGLSTLASYLILTRLLDLPLHLPIPELALLSAAILAGVVLTGLIGTRAARTREPLAVLRSE
ncbi:MAG: FtsX-like permease family protein [Planctomycetota bacterium]|nr:MAG: FtsX-like permease family protein [Planctomycetota bacterium]